MPCADVFLRISRDDGFRRGHTFSFYDIVVDIALLRMCIEMFSRVKVALLTFRWWERGRIKEAEGGNVKGEG